MIVDITYDSFFLTFEVDKDITTDPITAYSYDGNDYDFTSGGGETSAIFIN